MLKVLSFVTLLLLLGGCQEQEKEHFNKPKLIEQKCSKCHNLALPPESFEDEAAPPMMAVAFHVKSFMHVNDESARIPKAIAFVNSYVMHPSREKSLCDKASLDSYGLMPSQKENLTDAQLQAIAEYMFEHYTQKNLNEAQAIKNRLNAMPKGERLALKNNCLSCHKVDKKIVGPSLQAIAKRYKSTPQEILKSIENGSKNRWSESKNAQMPAFKTISKEDRESIAEWILSL